MTDARIERLALRKDALAEFMQRDPRHRDWPVVYTLNDAYEVYVGESVDAAGRLRQHLDGGVKSHLGEARVVVDPSFNKSACLDLEAYLIGLLSGEGRFTVLNVQASSGTGDYYERAAYRERFRDIFEGLRADGLFTTSIEQIENSDLYKLSPFKSLTDEQGEAVLAITEGLLADLRGEPRGAHVVEGGPGTGKTIVAIFLIKLLRDIGAWDGEPVASDSFLAGLFTPENRTALARLRIGFVVPQQSLRSSVAAVFKKTPGLSAAMVLSPFEVGNGAGWDLLVVDEAHRLGQRSNQASGPLNKAFTAINERLFGADEQRFTQLDWVDAQSHHQLLMVDRRQRIKPGDLEEATLVGVLDGARSRGRRHVLTSQLRVRSGDYVEYVRSVLSPTPPAERIDVGDYDLRLFDDVRDLLAAIREREREAGLARVVAGFAWPWVSKRDAAKVDIVIGDVGLRWNSRIVDWVDSPNARDEVGSIHTIQGYDLNYAGVIIGRDLRFDEDAGRLVFDRAHYFDKKGRQNNPGRKVTDDELLEFVTNIYGVLLTRGIRGTYVHVVDEPLRRYLGRYFR